MTKDAQKLLKHIIDETKGQNSTTVKIDISEIKNIPNIEFAQKKLLNELEAAGVISGYQANILGEVFVYLTSDGLEYFDDLRENKESSDIVFNVSGGQINIANDKGSINAVINDKLSEKDTILESEYKENNKVSLSSNKKVEKVFISYSWTPDCNKKWVEQLVNRLESDGIEVVVDFKDLKLGHDKYAFMERTVNDDTIKKVLVICNKTYKEKADGRIGGVGDESAIITSQMYGNVRQEKFIPVVNEYDENGKPFLPNYLASRMYADLTDFEVGYKQLLNNIDEVDETDVPTVKKETEKEDIEMFMTTTRFFSHRLKRAFPGTRGLKEFIDPQKCVDRLEILLSYPLCTNISGNPFWNNRDEIRREDPHKYAGILFERLYTVPQKMDKPIWGIRGKNSWNIQKFSKISSTKFLINEKEIEVKRVIVYTSKDFFRSFVYVEAYPEESIGILGETDQKTVEEMIKMYGVYYEEYAIDKGNIITRAEYDDRAAEIDGKIVNITSGAELRVRYLTPYNFVICAEWSPINDDMFDDSVRSILNGILSGARTIEELVTLVEKAPEKK